jgi:GNAT superfamily N-acetyltransferase
MEGRENEMRYRRATVADLDALVGLLAEIMTHHGLRPPPDDRLADVLQAAMAKPSHEFVVAEDDDGLVVGSCALLFSISTWSLGPACELQDVVVTESRRGAGVGRGLLEAAETIARDRDCKRLSLTTEAWNFRAHDFYRRAGMAEKTCLYFETDLSG